MGKTESHEIRAGIIGLGNMGGRVAQRIFETGFPIVGFDRSAEACARWDLPTTETITDLVAQSDIILISLPNTAVIEAVMYGEGGIVENARAGQTVVDLSTASPESTRRIYETLRQRDIAFIDGGLTGGVNSASTGTMTVMLGGDEEAIDSVRRLLDTFSSAAFRMGPSGAGHLAKVFTNFLNGVALAATAEVMVAAQIGGLNLPELLEVFNRGSAVNWATRERFPHIVEGNYLEGGLTIDLMMKDIGLYVDATRALHAPSLMGSSCFSAFQMASSLGYGDQISNRVVDAIGDLAGGVRVHE